MRVYEMTDHPVAREMIGYLLVRGGVHILAYAKAWRVATGTTKVSRKVLRSPNMRSFPKNSPPASPKRMFWKSQKGCKMPPE